MIGIAQDDMRHMFVLAGVALGVGAVFVTQLPLDTVIRLPVPTTVWMKMTRLSARLAGARRHEPPAEASLVATLFRVVHDDQLALGAACHALQPRRSASMSRTSRTLRASSTGEKGLPRKALPAGSPWLATELSV